MSTNYPITLEKGVYLDSTGYMYLLVIDDYGIESEILFYQWY